MPSVSVLERSNIRVVKAKYMAMSKAKCLFWGTVNH
jgi:hypothetical protein